MSALTEAILHRLWPPSGEITLGAIAHLQPQAYAQAALAAGLGGMVANLLLYGLGRLLRKVPPPAQTPQQVATAARLQQCGHRYLPVIAVIAALVPAGGVAVLLAGYCRGRPAITLLCALAGEMLSRAWPLLGA